MHPTNDAVLKRLSKRHGAPVDVIPIPARRSAPRGGWLQIHDGQVLIRVHGSDPLPATLAKIELDFPSGPQSYAALLEPVDPRTWRALNVRPLESRAHSRVPVTLPAQVGVAGAELDVPVAVHDLSADGLGFDSLAYLDVEQWHQIRFEGDLGERLGILRGRLVHKTSTPPIYRYGMRITAAPKAQGHVYEYLFGLKASAR